MELKGYYSLRFDGPIYCPYYGTDKEFYGHYQTIAEFTPIGIERLWTLYLLARQCLKLSGEFFECGVYAGGSALFLARIMEASGKKLHLFDTFSGMPQTDPAKDVHVAGVFSDAPIEKVRDFVGHAGDVVFHEGFIPDTFAGLENTKIAFAHVDVDIYQSMRDCCEFIYPRLVKGGVMVMDDYGQPSCPGAREAIDEYFADKDSIPISMLNTQAVIFKI